MWNRALLALWVSACIALPTRAVAQRSGPPAARELSQFAALVDAARSMTADSSIRLLIDPRPLVRAASAANQRHLAAVGPATVSARRTVLAQAGVSDTNALVPLGRCLRASGPPTLGSREDCPRATLRFVMMTLPVGAAKTAPRPEGVETARIFIKYVTPTGFGERIFECTLARQDGAWRVRRMTEVFPPGPAI
jgi:hypothetical protein